MFQEIQALVAIKKTGGVGKAATLLRITQPALTKRIKKFEAALGKPLIERLGRGIVLTTFAEHLCTQAAPLLGDLQEILTTSITEKRGPVTVAMTDSSLVSWGANFLGWLKKSRDNFELNPIVVPSASIVAQNVLSGEVMLGVIRGAGENTYGLEVIPLADEPMCLVPASLKPLRLSTGMKIDILSVESSAESHQIALRKLRRIMPKAGIEFTIIDNYRSGPAVVAAAKAGLGHGLVTTRLAKVMGISEKRVCSLPSPGVSVPTSLLARKRILQLKQVQEVLTRLNTFFAL